MPLDRIRVAMSGGGVTGPGLMTFYQDSTGAAAAFADAIHAFLVTIANSQPTDVIYTVPDGGDILDETTGAITGSWGTGTSRTVAGAAAGAYAQGVGARIRWVTAGVVGKRHVTGTTFVVPLGIGGYASDGGLVAGASTNLTNAATTLLTTMGSLLNVWSRPTGARAGTQHIITGSNVPTKTTWLISRRT